MRLMQKVTWAYKAAYLGFSAQGLSKCKTNHTPMQYLLYIILWLFMLKMQVIYAIIK